MMTKNRRGENIPALTTNGSGVLQQHVVILSSPTNEEEKEATIHMMTEEEEKESTIHMMTEEKEEDGTSPPLPDGLPPSSTTLNQEKINKEGSIFFRPIEKCEETRIQYAKVGLDMVGVRSIHRFKALAAALVIEKEAQMMAAAAASYLGGEKDVVMEESIECVPKNFLDEISQSSIISNSNSNNDMELERDATAQGIRVMSVGELLSLLEV